MTSQASAGSSACSTMLHSSRAGSFSIWPTSSPMLARVSSVPACGL